MSNEESLSNDQPLSYYINRARSMMDIYKASSKFYSWLNKFEFVADIIEVPGDKMIQFFNHMVENDTLIHVQLCFPNINYSQLSYEEIIKLYHYLFDNFDNVKDTYRERFLCREQFEQEPIQKYAANLEKIYSKCEYITRKDSRIRDRFISGLRDEDIKRKLEQSHQLTFIRVVYVAFEMTIVKKYTQRL
ncbi:hypothetical protein M0804_013299 [Polistes exclamans]|nr:hypothetical protein M0804_013299 [Polistes exclamans]